MAHAPIPRIVMPRVFDGRGDGEHEGAGEHIAAPLNPASRARDGHVFELPRQPTDRKDDYNRPHGRTRLSAVDGDAF